ncbi:MAG: hypothetical protein ACI4C1_08170 [Lachnospiraceae bacterium]
MKKKRNSEWKVTASIWWLEFRSIFLSSRWVVVTLITYFMVKFYLQPLISFADIYDLSICPAVIPLLYSNTIFISMGMFVIIFMMSNFPVKDSLQRYVLVRSSGKAWINGQILALISLAVVWLIELQLSILLCLGERSDWSEWGQLWWTLASGKLAEYGFMGLANAEESILQFYTPFQASIWSSVLILLTTVIFGEIIFLLDGILQHYVGEIILAFWSLLWFVIGIFQIDNLRFLRVLSPKNYLDIGVYVNKWEKSVQMLGILIGFILLFYILIRFCNYKKIITCEE